MLGRVVIVAAAIFAWAMSFGIAAATDVRGVGATAPFPLYSKWARESFSELGHRLNYYDEGSLAGIHACERGRADFCGTEIPVNDAYLKRIGFKQYPVILFGIVPIVNLAGIGPGQLVLNAQVLAGIYLGEVKLWNDPAIEQLNPHISLPAQPIAVVRRSDGSGTTSIFSNYLSQASAKWRSQVGVSAHAIHWPVGIAAKGNGEVANRVARTYGAIGYVAAGYAKSKRFSIVSLINNEGNKVSVGTASIRTAVANADWNKARGYHISLTNLPGEGAWPIIGASYILVREQPENPIATAAALELFYWAFFHGAETAEAMGYVPIPGNLVSAVADAWAMDIRDDRNVGIFKLGKAKPLTGPAAPPAPLACALLPFLCLPAAQYGR